MGKRARDRAPPGTCLRASASPHSQRSAPRRRAPPHGGRCRARWREPARRFRLSRLRVCPQGAVPMARDATGQSARRRECRPTGPRPARARRSHRGGTAGSEGRRRTRLRQGTSARRPARRRGYRGEGSDDRPSRAASSRRTGDASTMCSVNGRMETEHAARRTQKIGHQRAASRSKLDQPDRRRRSAVDPGLRQTKAQKLAEHLGDLRRRGEVARRPKRVPRDVIAVPGMRQAFGHVLGDGYRARGADSRDQDVLQAHALWRARRHARTRSARPTRIIGSDSLWPWVRPQLPNCTA